MKRAEKGETGTTSARASFVKEGEKSDENYPTPGFEFGSEIRELCVEFLVAPGKHGGQAEPAVADGAADVGRQLQVTSHPDIGSSGPACDVEGRPGR